MKRRVGRGAGPAKVLLGSRGRAHYVEVRVYEHRAGMVGAMRRCLKRAESDQEVDGGEGGVGGCCVQWPKVAVEGALVATILLHRGQLDEDTVVHECFHAGWWLAHMMGYSEAGDDFEEVVVSEGAALAEAVLRWVRRLRHRCGGKAKV